MNGIPAPYLHPVLIPHKQRHIWTVVVLPCIEEPVQYRQQYHNAEDHRCVI